MLIVDQNTKQIIREIQQRIYQKKMKINYIVRIIWEIVKNNMKDNNDNEQKKNTKQSKTKTKNIKHPMIWISLLKQLLIVNGIDDVTADDMIRIIYQSLGLNSKSKTGEYLFNNPSAISKWISDYINFIQIFYLNPKKKESKKQENKGSDTVKKQIENMRKIWKILQINKHLHIQILTTKTAK